MKIVRVAAPLLALAFLSCLQLSSPVAPPEGVAASQGTEEDLVVVTWNPIAGAGVYNVYRADSAAGEYSYVGSTAQTAFIDNTVLPEVHYWYRVGALDYFGSAESEKLSVAVKGWGIHIFAWSEYSVSFGAEVYSLAVDDSEFSGAYAAWADVDQTPVEVSRYSNGEWTAVGESFGITDGSIPGALSVSVVDGLPYVVYRDESAAGALTAAVLENTGEDEVWLPLGVAGQTSEPVRDLTSAGLAGELHVIALDDTDPADPSPLIISRRFTAAGGWETVTPPGGALATGSNPRLVSDGSSAALVVEDDADPDSTFRFYTYNSGWVAFTVPFPTVSVGNAPDGYLDFAVDAVTGDYAVAYLNGTDNSLRVYTFDGAVWTDKSPTVTPDPEAGSVGIAAHDGKIYLFYRDLAESAGIVLMHDGVSWEPVPLDDNTPGITGRFNVSDLELEVNGRIVFAAAREGSNLTSDVYE